MQYLYLKIFAAIFCVACLTACADDSSNSYVSSPYIGAYSQARSTTQSTDQAVKSIMQHVASMPQEVTTDQIVLADEEVSINVTRGIDGSANGIAIVKNSPVGFFPPGRYRVDGAEVTDSDRVFLDVLKKYVVRCREEFDRSNHQYTIQATFTGTADGMPTRNTVYAGEFGPRIVQPAVVNGVRAEVSLEKGQKVSNEQLAFLRALSLSNVVHNLVPNDFLASQTYVANTSPRVGREWRSVQVVFTFVPNGTGS
jgi:hypothetical protein